MQVPRALTLQPEGTSLPPAPHAAPAFLLSYHKLQVLCALRMQMVEEFLAQPQARHGAAQSSVPDQWADQFGAEGYGASEWADQFADQLAAGTDVNSWMEDFAKEMDEQVAAQRGEPQVLVETCSQHRGECVAAYGGELVATALVRRKYTRVVIIWCAGVCTTASPYAVRLGSSTITSF